MADTKFDYVEGVVNTGDSDERLVARKTADGNTELVFCAYGGLRVVELKGDVKFDDVHNHLSLVKELHDNVGDDFEVMAAVKVNDDAAMIAIDSMDKITWAGCDPCTEVTASNVYEAEEYDQLEDEDILMAFDLELAC